MHTHSHEHSWARCRITPGNRFCLLCDRCEPSPRATRLQNPVTDAASAPEIHEEPE